jgi:hypothetical protein
MSDKRQFLYFKDKIKMAISHVEFFLHTTNKIPSEKQNVKSSPDRADILPKSRRAREIKAIAGLNAV